MEKRVDSARVTRGRQVGGRRRRSDQPEERAVVVRKPKTRGERVIAFIERYCRIPDGTLIGQPFRLADFQRRFLLDVYDNPHGTSLAILSIARKNGKTALIAALVLAHLVGPEARRNSQIVSGAMSRDQASIVFDYATKIVMQSPVLRAIVRIVPSRKVLIGLPQNVRYEALASEARTSHGLSPVLAILDEIGQVRGPSSSFIDAIITSQGAHTSPLAIAISTQAPNDGDMLSLWIDDAQRGTDPKIVCHLYTAPADSEIMDEDAWRAANPGLDEFRSRQDLRTQAERALRMPSAENTFRNLCLNQRVETATPFIAPSVWKSCAGAIDEQLFLARPVYGGLDLSSRVDLTALVLAVAESDAPNSPIHLRTICWTPAEGLAERARTDRAPYDLWVRQGYMVATPGAGIDYAYVAGYIGELIRAGFKIQNVAYDRWRIDLLRKELMRADVYVDLVPHGQGYKDMSPALDQLEEDLLSGRIRHGDNPVLTMCAMNAVVEKDPAGNRKLVRNRATGRIDAIVAATMAVGLLRSQRDASGVAPMISVI